MFSVEEATRKFGNAQVGMGKRFNMQTFQRANLQTFKPANLQTFQRSNVQTEQ
jgi:hypothetical protein